MAVALTRETFRSDGCLWRKPTLAGIKGDMSSGGSLPAGALVRWWGTWRSAGLPYSMRCDSAPLMQQRPPWQAHTICMLPLSVPQHALFNRDSAVRRSAAGLCGPTRRHHRRQGGPAGGGSGGQVLHFPPHPPGRHRRGALMRRCGWAATPRRCGLPCPHAARHALHRQPGWPHARARTPALLQDRTTCAI